MRALGPSGVGTYRTTPQPGLRPLDAADPAAVARILGEVSPEVVFFPAANPNVDWCEQEPEQAERANLAPLRTMLGAASHLPFVAYSSDYVFDGTAGPYGESDRVSPISVYGRIKGELERLVLAAGGTVIRTTGVFGTEPPPAKNFALRLAAALARGEHVRIPNDQIANPTYADDLAGASLAIARTGLEGIWHVGGPDLIARDAFARLVAETFRADPLLIEGVPTTALRQAAPRPLRGGLRCERYRSQFGVWPGRPLRDALVEIRERLPGA